MARSIQIVFDAADPDRLARFWAAALGYKLQDPPEGHATWPEFLKSIGVPETEWNAASAVVDPDGKGPRIFFQKVAALNPSPSAIHLDVSVTGGPGAPLEERRKRIDAEVARLLTLGASTKRVEEDGDDYWVVMRDPEGNAFCVQ